jgi:glycerol-3-phosphate acyltransferase PlsX
MGGDHGASANVDGAIASVREDGASVILVGDETELRTLVEQRGATSLLDNGLAIRHAPEVVAMDEKPAHAVRKKKGSSMRVACDLVKNGEAAGAVSAGNSGAMMAVALFVFGRLDGVIRPCIAAAFPTPTEFGFAVLVDAGANTECTPEQLFQFGLMGSVYLQDAHDVPEPTIGVISNGTEESKGTDLTRGAVALLAQSDLNTRGHIEPNNVLHGDVHVAVADGFTGNIVLKTGEAMGKLVNEQIRRAYGEAGVFGKLGGALSGGVFKKVKEVLDPNELGAAPLLGLGAPAFIAHGSSDAYTIRRAIDAARRHVGSDITAHIEKAIADTRAIIDPPAATEKQA